MNIIEAVKELKNGKYIKRKEWYLKLFTAANSIWIYGATDIFYLKLADILTNDWEVVE